MSDDDVIAPVEAYYTGRVREFGTTPRGVDWNGEESQNVRFDELLAVVRAPDRPFSIIDWGCGYGALVDVLRDRFPSFTYVGYDVSETMVQEARRIHGDVEGVRFTADEAEVGTADYTVASGIFNVRLDVDEERWRAYVLATIDRLAAASEKGFAFNALTGHADADRMRPDLHYADPATLLDHCLRAHSRDVRLVHDYGLYEFTLLVRTDGRPPANQKRSDA